MKVIKMCSGNYMKNSELEERLRERGLELDFFRYLDKKFIRKSLSDMIDPKEGHELFLYLFL